MELALWLAVLLFVVVLVPFLIYETRRGKALGRSIWTWCRPRGHADVGPDTGRGVAGGEVPEHVAQSDECVRAAEHERAQR